MTRRKWPVVERVKALDLKGGETLIFEVERGITAEDVDMLKDALDGEFPDQKVLVLCGVQFKGVDEVPPRDTSRRVRL